VSAQEVATEHARDRAARAEAIRQEARAAWDRVDPARITVTWTRQTTRLLVFMTAAQRLAAAEADTYLNVVLDQQGIDPASQGELDPSALSGIASDGRPLESLLAQPAITALTAIGAGYAVDQAMTAGGFLAGLIGHTQVADAGRVADGVALASRKHAGGYVRMTVGKSCGRCIILAGRHYAWNAGFDRHPKDDCVHVPTAESDPNDLRVNPKEIFESMTREEQDKAFTKAGAEAIRLGADPARVVNARRGMQTASIGGRDVLVTTEAAGRRPRLMPEAIFSASGSDRDQAIRLLRTHGFIL
jgi:hypothetical protein